MDFDNISDFTLSSGSTVQYDIDLASVQSPVYLHHQAVIEANFQGSIQATENIIDTQISAPGGNLQIAGPDDDLNI
jgi:hypothetical protein